MTSETKQKPNEEVKVQIEKVRGVVKFKFRPFSYNLKADEIILIGNIVAGPLVAAYTNEIVYLVHVSDEKRSIHGTLYVPEKEIIESYSFNELAKLKLKK